MCARVLALVDVGVCMIACMCIRMRVRVLVHAFTCVSLFLRMCVCLHVFADVCARKQTSAQTFS